MNTLIPAAGCTVWCLYFLWTPVTRKSRLFVAGFLLVPYLLNRVLGAPTPASEFLNLLLAILLAHLLALALLPADMRLVGRSYHNFGIKAYWLAFLVLLTVPKGARPAGNYLLPPARWEILGAAAAVAVLFVGAAYGLKKKTTSPIEFDCYRAGFKNSLTWDSISAICEELVFRGYLLAALGQFLTAHPANALQAGLFGVAHFRHGRPGGGRGILWSAAWGVLLGYAVLWSGSLLPAVAIHAGIMPFFGPVALLAVRSLRHLPQAEVRLFRCACQGNVYLCDGRNVRIELDPVANRVLDFPESWQRSAELVSRLEPDFRRQDIESALAELQQIERRGAILEPHRVFPDHPPCERIGGSAFSRAG